jgi:putative transposase
MTNESYYTLFEEIIEDLQGGGKDSLTKTISTLMNVAMKIEQEKALQASPYERNEERTGQRNGYKDKTLKTRVGEIPVQIPQVRGMEFYPGAIDKGDRSERALKTCHCPDVHPGSIDPSGFENCRGALRF